MTCGTGDEAFVQHTSTVPWDLSGSFYGENALMGTAASNRSSDLLSFVATEMRLPSLLSYALTCQPTKSDVLI